MRFKSIAFAAAAAVLLSIPAWAHHSHTNYNTNEFINLSGTITEVAWTNPHVWIHLMVPDEAGTPREWSFEMQAIAQDAAAGWRSDSVKPGDKIRIEFHPLKDGSRGGQLMNATLADGKYLGPPAAPQRVFPRPNPNATN
jgi:hypothetical protein